MGKAKSLGLPRAHLQGKPRLPLGALSPNLTFALRRAWLGTRDSGPSLPLRPGEDRPQGEDSEPSLAQAPAAAHRCRDGSQQPCCQKGCGWTQLFQHRAVAKSSAVILHEAAFCPPGEAEPPSLPGQRGQCHRPVLRGPWVSSAPHPAPTPTLPGPTSQSRPPSLSARVPAQTQRGQSFT